QQARNLALTLGERLADIKFLLRDRGSNFTASFDAVFQSAGTRILRTAARAPRMNATCERLAGTLRREFLDRMLILGEDHLRAALAEYQVRYNTALPHQARPSRSCPIPRIRCGGSGWAHRQPTGSGRGGAVVVLRAGESPAHGEGRQRVREGMDAAMPEDAPPNGGAPGRSLRGRGLGYRRCRPGFTAGRRPMLAAGSVTCSTSCMTRRR